MSNFTLNKVQELMESYQAVYDPDLRYELEEEKEIEELGLQIIENAAYTLFSQGYDVNDLIDYFSEANEEVITEDAIAISEGVFLSESFVVSDEYIDEQFQNLREISNYLIREGVWDSAMNFVGRVASKPARMAAGARLANSSNPARTAKAYERLAGQKLVKAGFAKPPAGSFKNTADAARAAALAKPAGFLSKAASKVGGAFKAAKGALSKLPAGAKGAGKLLGRAAPGVGAALYGMDAANRFKKGDWGGGLLSGAGAVTSLIPGAGIVGALAPAGIQMATDAMGLTGDKSLKGKGPSGAPKSTPSSTKWNASKALGGKAAFSAGGGTAKMKSNPQMSAADVQKQGMVNIRNKKPPATAPAAPSGSGGSGGGGRASSTPATPRSSTPATPKPNAPQAQGTPMQQWARANPTLASKVTVGQSGYDEISQIRDKPGPYEKQDQTPTQGPTPTASQQDQLNKTGYAPLSPQSSSSSVASNAEREKKKREAQGATTTSESYDAFDLVLEYLFSEGHTDTLDEALYVMMEMDGETIQSICEAAADQSNKQIEKGVKATYKAQNVLDNLHQGRSRGIDRLHPSKREGKVERMRARLKARRDDLFGERNKREDESREKLKKLLGL